MDITSTSLIVKYKGSLQSCFISLPQPYYHRACSNKGSYPLKLAWDARSFFVGASTLRPSSSADTIEISPIFARCLQLRDNEHILVELNPRYQAVPICLQVVVQPESLDDWEIIATSAGYLESHILSQIDILQCGSKYPFWVKGQALIHIRVLSASNEGCEFVRLGQNSSVVVKPPTQPPGRSSFQTIIDSIRLRVNHCIDRIGSNRVAAQQCVLDHLELPSLAIVRLSNGKQQITTQLIALDNCPPGHVLIPPTLRTQLSVQRFDSVVVSILNDCHPEIDATNMGTIPALLLRRSLHFHLPTAEVIDVTVEQAVVLIGPDAIIEDSNGNLWSLRLNEHYIVHGDMHTVLHIKAAGEATWSDSVTDSPDEMVPCSAFLNLLEEVSLNISLCLSRFLKSDLLVSQTMPHFQLLGGTCFTGAPGIGKSSFLRALSMRLMLNPNTVAANFFINCSSLVADKIEDIKCQFKSVFSDAIVRAPAIVVFDDLDRLIPYRGENDSGTELRSAQIAEYLSDLFSAIRNSYPQLPLIWVASASTYSSLQPSIRYPGGFSTEIGLPVPDYDMRKEIFLEHFKSKSIGNIHADVDILASKTDGFVAEDIVKLIHRAVHKALSEQPEASPGIETTHFETALNSFTPRSKQGIDLKTSEVVWSDIGGLDEVCSTLKETFELPGRYPFLFVQSPLKLRSGLLLYGPPGCGKTLIASAVARECGLNFISIKGPELLNKYIGASEQGVREQFSRAAAVAPCILFFDEFESIAPRRGADSTGVTDRVVNQILCHLDGVELRTGVFVLAATSRPDLLDPALLRPGRFDKCLYCGVPDLEARVSILQKLSSKMKLSSNVDFFDIAERTSNFTGADLQGLLNSAQIAAIHDALKQRRNEALISMSHFEDAIGKARISVSSSERQRFTSIYAAFTGSKPSDFSLQFREGKIGCRTAVK